MQGAIRERLCPQLQERKESGCGSREGGGHLFVAVKDSSRILHFADHHAGSHFLHRGSFSKVSTIFKFTLMIILGVIGIRKTAEMVRPVSSMLILKIGVILECRLCVQRLLISRLAFGGPSFSDPISWRAGQGRALGPSCWEGTLQGCTHYPV